MHESARFTAKSDRELGNTFFFLDVYFPLAPFQLVEPARELVRDWLQPRDKLDEWDRDDATIRWVLAIPLRSSAIRCNDSTRSGETVRSHHFASYTHNRSPHFFIYIYIYIQRTDEFSLFAALLSFLGTWNKEGRRATMTTTRRRRPLAVPPDGYTRVLLLRAPLRTFFHP